MKVITHESDEGFQQVAVIMAAFAVVYGILSMAGSTAGIKLLQGPYDEMGIAGFAVTNLIFSNLRGTLRYYAGSGLVEASYLLFLCTGLVGIIFMLANVLASVFSFK